MADVHVLDEADGATGPAEVASHGQDGLLVPAALHDHVDLDGPEPRLLRCRDPLHHAGHREVGVVHAAEGGIVERVEGDRHSVETRVRQRLLTQQHAVGGHGDVEGGIEVADHRHQLLELHPDQRLATGEANGANAVPLDEDAGQAADLLVAQDLLPTEPPEALGRHAVHAAEVAAVGDGDAQVVQRPAARVHWRGHRRSGQIGHRSRHGTRTGERPRVVLLATGSPEIARIQRSSVLRWNPPSHLSCPQFCISQRNLGYLGYAADGGQRQLDDAPPAAPM